MSFADDQSARECLRCGACCFSPSAMYVPVTGDDWSRLGNLAERYAHFIGHRAFMRMEANHCAALVVRPHPLGGEEFWCSVYERRPLVCRELERGSGHCEAARELQVTGWNVSGWGAGTEDGGPGGRVSGAPAGANVQHPTLNFQYRMTEAEGRSESSSRRAVGRRRALKGNR